MGKKEPKKGNKGAAGKTQISGKIPKWLFFGKSRCQTFWKVSEEEKNDPVSRNLQKKLLFWPVSYKKLLN